MKILIDIIALVQAFAAGMYFENERSYGYPAVKLYPITIAIFFAGILFIPLTLTLMISGLLYRVWNHFSLGFMFKYMLLKRPMPWAEAQQEAHKAMLKKVESLSPKWYDLSDKAFIYCVKFISKKYYNSEI